ncbi:putative serine dehydratase domain-containing protein [Ampelomyces quisqualis]|uniref:D-serine dehydratase n=1 Tax=Ampelomyces quisqualis TaxID=50730 RepID=A0A6A5QYN3_AMPQU|nr:putative serine dehydratase domain-containing protein [Ampelomyces quisqualis]
MLQVCKKLDVGFRAHVKSHKTIELACLQVGETGPANFIVSTLIEAEHLADLVLRWQGSGREASILYGIPVPQSAIPRLISLAHKLLPRTLNVIVDNLEAFAKLQTAFSTVADEIGVFIKIDTGYHRAGITTSSANFAKLVEAVTSASKGTFFQGFYSHYGHSYGGSSEDDAATGLIEELIGLETACAALPTDYAGTKPILTVGATPTATAAQNMLFSSSPRVQEFHDILARLQTKYAVELHAGVYPLLDCQQIATHARPSSSPASECFQPLSKDSIAIRMLLEVTSIYTERSKPEALVSAGSLALGRDPCKSYPGWGVVTPDLANARNKVFDETGDGTGWIVGRISQEHGVLSWEGDKDECKQFEVGDKVMVWPNHACVAGAGFGWYLVVDSEEGDGETVVDVWCRWRGW